MDDAANDIKVLVQFCPWKDFPVMKLFQTTNVGGYSKLLTLLLDGSIKRGENFSKSIQS